ncbi:MAG: glycoside hydrolase family 32 protein [Clostridia bacterium]|nr:glycoside hydrolase family 32 protein [Clostridia bacterium]
MNDQDCKKAYSEQQDTLPAFHITGEKGWINDPNGLVFFKGEYHVFFQYHPFSTVWGPMHWGHVVSADLTNWRYLPIALAPGGKGDKDGCFSGTAICAFGKLYLMYTGFEENGGGDNIRQVQCLAESDDGVTFKKHGVVIGSDQLPEEYLPCDFRDPHVFCHDGKFYCLVAAKTKELKGRLLLYRSPDLFKWEFVGDTLGFDSEGIMFECPDFVEQFGMIAVCDQLPPPKEDGCLNVHSTRYFLGKMDFESGKFKVKSEGVLDYGFDYYAPQCFAGIDEKIFIGWLNMWDRNVPSAKYGFAGMLTVPRKMTVENGKVIQTPVVNKREVFKTSVDKNLTDKAVIGVIEIDAEGLESFELKLRAFGENFTSIKLENGFWKFDRSKSGEEIKGAEKDGLSRSGVRKMPFSGGKNTKITIVLDRYSVELFEGGNVMSSTIYPPENADKLALFIEAEKCVYTRYDVVKQ